MRREKVCRGVSNTPPYVWIFRWLRELDLNFNLVPLPSFPNQSSFGDSIAAWETSDTVMPPQDEKMMDTDTVKGRDKQLRRSSGEIESGNDLLMLKTREAIISSDVTEKLAKIPWHAVDLLKNTTHLKALASALHLAKSHHALGVEEVMTGKEETGPIKKKNLNKIKVAVSHHMQALRLISETQRLRAAFNISLLGGRLLKNSLIGAANAAPLISDVSYDFTLHSKYV